MRVSPFLWFDGQAEEAATYYVGLFPDSAITNVSRFGEGGPGPAGSAMTVSFELCGQPVTALNGGPAHGLTEAFSFLVNCETQAEVDRLWDALLADGGTPSRCGWLTDRFGLTWQVIPDRMLELMADPDPARAGRVVQAMLQMVKIDVDALERAYAG